MLLRLTQSFSQHFAQCKNKLNLTTSWKLTSLLGLLVKSNFTGENPISKIVRNNRAYTNKAEIADQFNKHFAYVGPNLAKNIVYCEDSPSQFIKSTPVGSFVMSSVTETQVCSLFKCLNENKLPLSIHS